MSPVGPVEPRSPLTHAERAFLAIQDKLILLDIRPMEAIVESDLVEQLGVGRTPIREALKQLAAERLIVSYPRRGTFAAGIDVHDLSAVSELRAHLEPVAARKAAENASEATRQKMLAMAEVTDGLNVRDADTKDILRWDMTVHRTIYAAAGNSHLEDVLVRYDNLATRIFASFIDRLPRVSTHVGEHSQLLRVIATGDTEQAALLAHEHVTGFEREVRLML